MTKESITIYSTCASVLLEDYRGGSGNDFIHGSYICILSSRVCFVVLLLVVLVSVCELFLFYLRGVRGVLSVVCFCYRRRHKRSLCNR